MSPDRRWLCATRALKHARTAQRPAIGAEAVAPLFHGTTYFVRIAFTITSQNDAVIAVDAADVQTAIAYATQAATPISQYATLYGPNALAIAPAIVDFAVTIADPSYTDAQLGGWADTIARQHGLSADACIAVLNPQGVVNTDASLSSGVIGYHSVATLPYLMVNVTGAGFTIADATDTYALGLSHELAEMVVDPSANAQNPEVCDPCAGNCRVDYRDYFRSGTPPAFVGGAGSFPPSFSYDFFIAAIAQPAYVSACPAPAGGCAYAPPATSP